MGFEEAMDAIARGVEILGILTIVLGLAVALVRAGRALAGGRGGEEGYRIVRTVFGRSILLGLEFLVAGDIIKTVAIEPTLESVIVLVAIELVRTVLSLSIDVEIDGRWPWQAAQQAGDTAADAAGPGAWGTTIAIILAIGAATLGGMVGRNERMVLPGSRTVVASR